MVEIGLVKVDVHGVVAVERRGLDELLDGCHLGVHEELAAVQVAREAAHAVVHRDDVRIELRDHVIERLERRNLTTGGDVDVDAERRDARFGVEFRVCVHRDVTLVEMREDCVAEDGGLHGLLAPRGHGIFFRDEHRDARPLRVVVLFGDVEDPRADHLRDFREDLREAFGIVLLVDVFDVVLLFARCLGVTDVVNVETEGFRQVVEAVKFQLFLQSS